MKVYTKYQRPGPPGFRQEDLLKGFANFCLFVAIATIFLHGMKFFEQLSVSIAQESSL